MPEILPDDFFSIYKYFDADRPFAGQPSPPTLKYRHPFVQYLVIGICNAPKMLLRWQGKQRRNALVSTWIGADMIERKYGLLLSGYDVYKAEPIDENVNNLTVADA